VVVPYLEEIRKEGVQEEREILACPYPIPYLHLVAVGMDMVGMEMEGEDNHVRDAPIPSHQLVV